MLKLLTPDETRANLPAMMATRQFRNTTLSAKDIFRFLDVGALIAPAIMETSDHADTFIPRGHFFVFLLGEEGHQQMLAGAMTDSLTPWSGSGPAYAFILNVYSTIRNGMARLAIAFSEQLADHSVVPHLQALYWYTRTAKGLAMNEYFGGSDTGRTITRRYPNGDDLTMPLFVVSAANWRTKLDSMVERLLGIEDRFTEDLSTVHQALRTQIPGFSERH